MDPDAIASDVEGPQGATDGPFLTMVQVHFASMSMFDVIPRYIYNHIAIAARFRAWFVVARPRRPGTARLLERTPRCV